MTKIVAIQMDAIESLNAKGDSTVVLALEAVQRGYSIFCYHPSDLCLKADGKLYTKAYGLVVRDPLVHDDWYDKSDYAELCLNDVDVVLMRQDPPFDMSYITATYLLERIMADTLVINHPASVRNSPEKMFPLDFAKYMPATMVSSSVSPVLEFMDEHQDIILKPLHGFGGHSIFHLRKGDNNIIPLLETLLSGDNAEPLVAQKFLPEVVDGDCRVILVDGKVEGVLRRVPPSGEIRANMRIGGQAVHVDLNDKQLEICAVVGEECRKRDLIFVGLDLIGDYLTEVNVTSPTGLRAATALDKNATPEIAIWDAIEKRL